MSCCQVCVFFFTAFLLVAERTARESYLGHIHLHPYMQNICTHTHITEHYASVAVLADCDHLPVQNAAPFFLLYCVCVRVCACFSGHGVWMCSVRTTVDAEGCLDETGGVRVTSCFTLKYKVVHLFLLQRLRCAVMNNRASAEVRSHSVSFLFLYTARYEILYAAGLLTHVRLFL